MSIDPFESDGLGRPLLSLRQSSNGTGDVYVGGKYKIIDPNDNWFSIALGGYLKIPVSRTDDARARGRTSGEYEYGPVLMLGQEFADHRFRVYENIGYIHTGDIQKRGVKVLDLRDKFLLSVGASYAVNKHIELVGELLHTRYVGNGTPSLFRNNPVELNLGARFYLKDGAISFGGAYRRFLNSDGPQTLEILECYMFHPGTADYGPPRMRCDREREEFGNGDSRRLSSATGSEVTVDTTGLGPGTYRVTVDVSTSRSSCDEPCRGASCSITFTIPSIEVPECKDILVPCGPIFFPFNSARINNEHKACLEEISLRLQQDPQAYVVIDGHRDSSERVGISLTRANNARDYLVSIGVSAGRITVRNFGDTCPHPNGDVNLNRRVEFYIVPGDYRSEPLLCLPAEEAIRRMKGCPSGRFITNESPAIERRPPARTPRRGTRRPEPVSELDDSDFDRDEDTGDGSADSSTARRATPVSSAKPPRAVSPQRGLATVIRAVRTSASGGVLRIYIDADGAAQFNAFNLKGPSRIVVDIRGVRSLLGSKVFPVDARFVERVRVGQPDPATVRVVLDITGEIPYEVIREGSSIVIIVGQGGPTAKTGSARTIPAIPNQ